MVDRQRRTVVMPRDWNLIETIYEDALPGQREAEARDVSRKMGLTIMGFLQAHPDQHFVFCYRVSKNDRRNSLPDSVGDVGRSRYPFDTWEGVIERRYHSVDVMAVETLHEMRALPTKDYADMSQVALSRSALEEIGRRMRGRWLRIKSALRRQ